MKKCECRVCKLSEHLKQNYEDDFIDFYMDTGLHLEGDTHIIGDKLSFKIYEEYFDELNIRRVYEQWKIHNS